MVTIYYLKKTGNIILEGHVYEDIICKCDDALSKAIATFSETYDNGISIINLSIVMEVLESEYTLKDIFKCISDTYTTHMVSKQHGEIMLKYSESADSFQSLIDLCRFITSIDVSNKSYRDIALANDGNLIIIQKYKSVLDTIFDMHDLFKNMISKSEIKISIMDKMILVEVVQNHTVRSDDSFEYFMYALLTALGFNVHNLPNHIDVSHDDSATDYIQMSV